MKDTKEKHTHTPGPWHAYLSRKDVHRTISSHDGSIIAKEVHHANARLIAAAPEMYETMKAILAVVNDPRPIFPGTAIGDKLREVLSKVDGGEG